MLPQPMRNLIRQSLTPCFWLVVPILALNVVYASRLPEMFQPEVFLTDIPGWITGPENTFRLLLFILTGFLPMRANRAGWALFLAGTAIYVASWAVLILAPEAGWSTSAAGRLAPAYTPALWLAGIGMIAGRPGFSYTPRRRWIVIYTILASGFLAAHITHTALVFLRHG
jgi:hypothetical protein